jgi:hypothetical protein
MNNPELTLAEQIRQMREALEAMKTTFSAQGREPDHWPPLNFDERQALDIAEQHGYGRLMQLLSAAWYADQRGGAFAVGTCVSLAAKAMRTLEAALALTPSQAEQKARENAEKAALLDEAHKHLVFALTLIRQCRTPSSPDWQADYATLLAFVFDLGEELEDKAAKEAPDA